MQGLVGKKARGLGLAKGGKEGFGVDRTPFLRPDWMCSRNELVGWFFFFFFLDTCVCVCYASKLSLGGIGCNVGVEKFSGNLDVKVFPIPIPLAGVMASTPNFTPGETFFWVVDAIMPARIANS